jgi:hypothetical protein
MNTVSSTLKEEIKKSHDTKKKERFKFISTILATNLLVAVVCMPSSETKIAEKQSIKIVHRDYQIMVLPLQALVSPTQESDPETAVSLLSKDKKIIAEKAYLHEEVKGFEGVTQFKIEISNTDVAKIGLASESGVIAVPYVENKKIKSMKRGSKYEVSL